MRRAPIAKVEPTFASSIRRSSTDHRSRFDRDSGPGPKLAAAHSLDPHRVIACLSIHAR
jgi:hypothetical protein